MSQRAFQFEQGYSPPIAPVAQAAPSHSHPNSIAAAQTVNLPKRRQEVLDCIAAHGPISDERGIELTGMANGWRARRQELARDRLIECCGQGESRCGNTVDLWRVKGGGA